MIEKPLIGLMKKRAQILNIIDEKCNIITDIKDIKKVLRGHYEELYTKTLTII